MACLFILLSVFQRANDFNFDEFTLPIFSFMDHAFSIIFKFFYLLLSHKHFLLFSHQSFIVLDFTFKFVIYFELVFVYGTCFRSRSMHFFTGRYCWGKQSRTQHENRLPTGSTSFHAVCVGLSPCILPCFRLDECSLVST